MIFIPLYWMLGWVFGTYTLSFIQVFLILFGGWAIYKLIELKTSNRLLAILAILHYFIIYGRWASFCSQCNLAIIASSIVPVFLYYFEKRKFFAASLAFVFILLAREDMSLWMLFIGVYLAITYYKDKKCRIASFIVIFASIGYFIFVFNVIIPFLENPFHQFNLFNYSSLGKNPSEAMTFILTRPIKAIELLFINTSGNPAYNYIKFEFYYVYFLAGGFLVFYRPKYLILFIPLIAKKMYNDDPIRWSIESYYSIEVVSILPIAIFLIISEIKNLRARKVLIYLVCFNSFFMTTFKLLEKGRELNYDNTNFAFFKSSMYKSDLDIKKINQQLKLIPPDAKVAACGSIHPHLAYRQKIYYFPRIEDSEYLTVFLDRDTYPFTKEQFEEFLNKFRTSQEWVEFVNDYPLLILKRAG